MKIITDHKWKFFKYGYEVPEKVMANQFDYLEEDSQHDGFFRYRGYWYHISDILRIANPEHFPGTWNGYHSYSLSLVS